MSANPSAKLVLFAYKGVSAYTHACITREVSSWPNLQHTVKPGEALICRARDFVASEYLQDSDAPDVLLMVDDDVQWQEGDLSYIARKALECRAVVGGIYPKRRFGEWPPIRLGPEVKGEFTFGADELLPATYISTGFMAIPREVLQAVAEMQPHLVDNTWPMFLPMVVEGPYGMERLSEDWAFCSRAASAGFRILAALKPRLTHLGEYQYRMIDAKTRPQPDEDVTITISEPDPVFDTLPKDIGDFCGLDESQVHVALNGGTEGVQRLWETKPKEQTELEFYERDDVGRACLFDLAAWHRRAGDLQLEELGLIKGQKILDYGSGIGTTALLLARQNTVDCVEPNKVMRDFTQFRAARLDTPIRFRNGRVDYDIVVCWHVLEHVSNPEETAAEVIAALRPGGRLFTFSDFSDDGSHPMHHLSDDASGMQFWNGLTRESRFWWKKEEAIRT